MASIRSAAQWVLDDCRDGIGWVAIWKEGRSWESERIYGVDFDEPTYTATIDDPEEQERLQAILAIDPRAIIVNGYYHNLGDPECMTRDTLADALRWQYELQNATVANFLENIVQAAHESAHLSQAYDFLFLGHKTAQAHIGRGSADKGLTRKIDIDSTWFNNHETTVYYLLRRYETDNRNCINNLKAKTAILHNSRINGR